MALGSLQDAPPWRRAQSSLESLHTLWTISMMFIAVVSDN
jgi:hypothetical protein